MTAVAGFTCLSRLEDNQCWNRDVVAISAGIEIKNVQFKENIIHAHVSTTTTMCPPNSIVLMVFVQEVQLASAKIIIVGMVV